MKIYTITVAFCPAAQLARSLLLYKNNSILSPCPRHIIIQGHYPVNIKKNNRDIEMIVEAYCNSDFMDPGKNLGSAQSQTWAIKQFSDCEAFINWDPDTDILTPLWGPAMRDVLVNDPQCALISCWSPIVEKFTKQHRIQMEMKITKEGTRYLIADKPIPFNLSMWRRSFIDDIGGIPQLGEYWGEVEGPFFGKCKMKSMYHAYLPDYMESEDGKYMQDRQLLEFKDLNMRTSGPERFNGNYTEYLMSKYPHLLEMDTAIPKETIFQ